MSDTDSDWQVFQRDVLDVLRQYEGFFDFFERVGSLSDDSRPDCFARISRKSKKEIWVVDAKNKPEIDEDDIERMENYIEMLKSNPIDAGLELKEMSDYTFRGIFVTSSKASIPGKYENVAFKSFHQLLQKELVYTDSDKVVRDVAKMLERKQLSQSQARLVFRSMKPFEQRIDRAMETLEKLEEEFVGLEVKRPPLSEFDFKLPVDAIAIHEERDRAFLFDIPYSREAVEEVDGKVEEIKETMSHIDREVFYAAINTFEKHESSYNLQPEEVEDEIKETAGIVSPEEIADLFTPKIRTERSYEDNAVLVRDTEGLGFQLKVMSSDDVNFRVEALLPEEVCSRIKDTMMNSQQDFGEVKNRRFQLKFEVTPEFEVRRDGNTENMESFRDAVRSVYQSSVNPVLGKKVKKKV